MNVNNLTNVYNNNPTLQGSYTLQQYLDLFGGTPPTSTIPPTDPNAPTTPITPGQGIINANINQFQGGGDGSGITTIGSNRINSNNFQLSEIQVDLNDIDRKFVNYVGLDEKYLAVTTCNAITRNENRIIDGVKNTATDF
jgi:hypothetical protein